MKNTPVIVFWTAVGLALGITLAAWSGAEGAPAWTFAMLLALIAAAIVGWFLTFLWRTFGPSPDSKLYKDDTN